MRQPKPSDFQFLELIEQEIEQLSVQMTIVRGRLTHLQKQIKHYITEDTANIEINEK